jgi:hypothetical protein
MPLYHIACRRTVHNRASFLRALAGRNVTLFGDSVSRDQFFFAAQWLFGCDAAWNGSDYDSDPLPLRAAADRAGVCPKLASQTPLGDNDPTGRYQIRFAPRSLVIYGAAPSEDINLRWFWSSYTSDLYTAGNRSATPFGTPPAAPTVADVVRSDPYALVVVGGLGFWHIRHPRVGGIASNVNDTDGLHRETQTLLAELKAMRPASGREPSCHIVWRDMTSPGLSRLGDRTRPLWDPAAVRTLNGMLDAQWEAAGFATVRSGPYMDPQPPQGAAAVPPGSFSADGLHPTAAIQVALFLETMATAAARLQECGRKISR